MIGTYTTPIPRDLLKSHFEPILKNKKTEYNKVVPTLVLFPTDNNGINSGFENEIPQEIKTILKTKKGETFEESVAKCTGKAILLNFCTGSLEIYPKSLEDCEKIYDMQQLQNNIVPNQYFEAKKYLEYNIQNNNPINPCYVDLEQVIKIMSYYSHLLLRPTWRIAFNKSNCTVSAMKLNYYMLKNMLSLYDSTFASGDKLYLQETFTPAYKFTENDYVLMDLEDGEFRKDKFKNTYVRIVNGESFEMTYNCITNN
jgi:hypothetical protein